MPTNVRTFPLEFLENRRIWEFDELDKMLLFVRCRQDLSGFNEQPLLYRGLGDANFRLLPSAFRNPGLGEILGDETKGFNDPDTGFPWLTPLEEFAILAKFYRYADQQGVLLPPVHTELHDAFVLGLADATTNRFGWTKNWPREEIRPLLALAQHHGVPTRLLDWSYSFETALYFALRSALHAPKPPDRLAIWMVSIELLLAASSSFTGEEQPRYGISLVKPPYGQNDNLRAQKGCFTLVSDTMASSKNISSPIIFDDAFFENIDFHESTGNPFFKRLGKGRTLLTKLTLPFSEGFPVYDHLVRSGHDAIALFPGLGGCRQAMLDRDAVKRAFDVAVV